MPGDEHGQDSRANEDAEQDSRANKLGPFKSPSGVTWPPATTSGTVLGETLGDVPLDCPAGAGLEMSSNNSNRGGRGTGWSSSYSAGADLLRNVGSIMGVEEQTVPVAQPQVQDDSDINREIPDANTHGAPNLVEHTTVLPGVAGQHQSRPNVS